MSAKFKGPGQTPVSRNLDFGPKTVWTQFALSLERFYGQGKAVLEIRMNLDGHWDGGT